MALAVAAAARCWPRAVAVLGAAHAGALHTITATAVSIASMNPPLVLASVTAGGRLHLLAEAAGGFAVSLLAHHQQHVAERCARPGRPADARQLDGLSWGPAPVTAAPILTAASAWFDCPLSAVQRLDGEQALLVGRIAAAGERLDSPRTTADALLRVGGRYHPLAEAGGRGTTAERR